MPDAASRPGKAARPARAALALLVAAAAMLAGCQQTATRMPGRSGLEATHSLDLPAAGRRQAGVSASPAAARGTILMDGRDGAAAPLFRKAGEKVTLNLVEVPIAVAAKTIFADILRKNFAVTGEVAGTVTLQTVQPVPPQDLVDSFEAVLAGRGFGIEKQGDTFRVVARDMLTTGAVNVSDGREVSAGRNARIVPLRFVSATEMERILKPMAPNGVLRADPARNLVVLSGTGAEIASMQETIALFDVDWMRGMSAGIFPLSSGASPAEIARQLEALFGGEGGPAGGAVRFLPSRSLGSVLVVASRPAYLERARHMIARLDDAASVSTRQTFIYKVENRTAKDMASIVQGIVGGKTGEGGGKATAVAVALAPAATEIEAVDPLGGAAEAGLGTEDAQSFSGGAVSVVADESNNALVLVATRREYDRLLPVLQSIDSMPAQVLIEAVIAEVTLNDELRFGLRWYFESRQNLFGLSDAANGVIGAVAPGFSYLFNGLDVKVVLNALSQVTNVKVVSSPTLTVLDNRSARLQIGDQVPIVKQSAKSTVDPTAPTVNEVEMKDTGVILKVTPRISSNGNILLDIDQEVSDVVRTTSSGIDSPTIRQRKISTTVVVANGQSIALGGLVQEKRERSSGGVPILDRLPVVGAAFRNREDGARRTELMIFLRSRVINDASDARSIAQEYRNALGNLGLDETDPRSLGTLQRISQ